MLVLDSNQKGNLTELQCMAAFIANGYTVSIPYGDNAKYDFIADIGGRLLKIQVKTAFLKKQENAAIHFSCVSTHINCKGASNYKYSQLDDDFFATYWDGNCYIVPITECSTGKTLRLVPPKNGQTKGIAFAEQYLLEAQLAKL